MISPRTRAWLCALGFHRWTERYHKNDWDPFVKRTCCHCESSRIRLVD